jgi:hypothetical protein
MVKKSGKRVYEDDAEIAKTNVRTDGKENGRRDALCEGNARNPIRDTRKFPQALGVACVATPMVWISGDLVGPLIQELRQRGLDLLSISVHSSQRLAHTGFPMIERRESITHIPGLTRNKEQLRLRQAGEGKKERKIIIRVYGVVASPNIGLNFLSADHPQTLNPKPLYPMSTDTEN